MHINYQGVFGGESDLGNIISLKKIFTFDSKLQELPLKCSPNEKESSLNMLRKKYTKVFENSKKEIDSLPQTLKDNHNELGKSIITKKVPESDISSFLLGINPFKANRRKKKETQKATESPSKTTVSPSKTVDYPSRKTLVRDFFTKMTPQKQEMARPYNNHEYPVETPLAFSTLREEEKIYLPNIELKKPKTREVTSTSFGTSQPTYSKSTRLPASEIKIEKPNQTISPSKMVRKFSSPRSIRKAAEITQAPKQFMKGYMHYADNAKEFWEQHISNSGSPIKHTLKVSDLTAKSFCIFDTATLTCIAGRNFEQEMEIASLSKIMTCYLCLLACKKYQVDLKDQKVRVSDRAAEMPGTSAELQGGDVISVYDLLFGLMLPSGNDASVALAQCIGRVIQINKKKETKKTCYQIFISHMNLLSRELKLDQEWSNSSGLSMSPNYSSPKSISILSALAMQDPLFKEIVSTRSYDIDIKNQRFGLSRKVTWKNTNKLLQKDWEGVKTGTTDTAGHCLMAKKDNLLISVYDCDTLAKRFTQCAKLYESIQEIIAQ